MGVLSVNARTPKNTKALRIAIAGDLNLLDPHSLNETLTVGLLGNVMESLTRRNGDLKIEPGLATHWENLSPTHWRFHLRRKVRFHDGSPFTADDVVFSLERARGPNSQMKRRIPADAQIVKVDDFTVDVILKQPNPIMYYDWDNLFIMSKAWAIANRLETPHAATERVRTRAVLSANGTGPFRLLRHSPGRETVFERNYTWWGERTDNVEKVVLTTIRSAASRVAALLSGQVDVVIPVPLEEIKRISGSQKARVIAGSELRTIFLNLDSFRDELKYSNVKGRNPFKDSRVRRAIYQAIDIEAIRTQLMGGYSEPSALLISPSLFALANKFKRHPFDRAKARELLREAGYPDGFSVVLDCPNNRYINDEAICDAIANMLAHVKIDVKVRAVTKARFFERVTRTRLYDSSMNLLGWTPGTMDGLEIITNLAGCRDADGNGALFNLGGYCNPEVDKLAAQARTETDLKKRDDLIAKAFRIIHDEAGLIPLHQQPLAWGVAKGVELTLRRDNQIRFDLMRVRELTGAPQ
ncbi:MAG: ABC transporter substrate-binding protein [Hyphomicrobiaceae bacterium]|nr:ABC transporter substrate-binding protein [Hyphomicrobiaceae bacterium]